MRHNTLTHALGERVLILDGAMGTMIQRAHLDSQQYVPQGLTPPAGIDMRGCNDLLCLSAPEVIEGIHRQYISAGADIIETNSFNANALSLAEYGASHLVAPINKAAVEIAQRAAATAGRQVWVAASIGPTGKSLSLIDNTDLERPAAWDKLFNAYCEQIDALVSAGPDILLFETIFDGLNAKAAAAAALTVMERRGVSIPVMVSATLTSAGRLLSGQTFEAFVDSISQLHPIAVGLNCGFGAEALIPHIRSIQHLPYALSLYPNAGLPNAMGEYDETPRAMAQALRPLLQKGMANIVGGCCGTTPEHIRAIAQEAKGLPPRAIPAPSPDLHLAGLDAFSFVPGQYINVGERCNVAGSRKFLRLISENHLGEALSIAAAQISAGADVIDVNMDDAMLSAPQAMCRFLAAAGADSRIARVPVMIDSSSWEVIDAALKCIQGRPIVNSISLKEGEKTFIERAREIRRRGAAMVVMAFDEQGQATTFSRRTEICARAFRLLTEQAGVDPHDIIFDPNILTIATGIDEHRRYAVDFLETARWIKENLPGARVSGGLSNLSFAFRGNEPVRRAMHSIFISEGLRYGMDMAIVNPSAIPDAQTIDSQLYTAIRDVIFDTDDAAVERLVMLATEIKAAAKPSPLPSSPSVPTSTSLSQMVVEGQPDGVEDAITQLRNEGLTAIEIIDKHLMEGMNRVGHLFAQGSMFLPQVVKSAQVMKSAVAILTPMIEAERASSADSAHRMVLATVKGDVHDIGKNIVGVIMHCNGFEVNDLGVMVPAQEIVDEAIRAKAHLVGLSGLITPSLEQMCVVARLMEERGLTIPLFVGGAAASAVHTAVKIAPLYSGPVVYTSDAASIAAVARRFCSPDSSEAIAELRAKQEQIRLQVAEAEPLISLDDARSRRPVVDFSRRPKAPSKPGLHRLTFTPAEVAPWINWRAFFSAWQMDASLATAPACSCCQHTEADKLRTQAQSLIAELSAEPEALIHASLLLLPAGSSADDIIVEAYGRRLTIPTLRRQLNVQTCPSLADYIAPVSASGVLSDNIGLFAVTTGRHIYQRIKQLKDAGDEYGSLLLQSVADRLVEAATELMHHRVRRSLWGYAPYETDEPRTLLRADYQGIRPAVGYPSLPDQSIIFTLNDLIDYQSVGIGLTEHGAMIPPASTTGLILAHPDARYFTLGAISQEQFADYASRRGMDTATLRPYLPNVR